MSRFFGAAKKKEPQPTLEDITGKLGGRQDSIQERIKKIDGELVRLRDRMKQMRPGPAQNSVKQQALRLLKQKKMYENQLGSLQSQSFNLDQAAFAAQQMKDTALTVSAMQTAAKELKHQFHGMRVEKIESLQDEMADLLQQSSEVQDVLARSYDLPENYVDEDDLEAELGGLEEEMAAVPAEGEAIPSYLQDHAPAVPTEAPPATSTAPPLTTQ